MSVMRERKLSREDVQQIVARYEAGEKVKAIADDYGVTPAAVSYRVSKSTVLRRDRGAAGIQHGSRAGYQAHKALGLSPCDDCRRANAEYMAAYQARLRNCSRCGIQTGRPDLCRDCVDVLALERS